MPELPSLDAARLLGRAELPIDLEPARRFLRDRRVLITGAGGSVGVALSDFVASAEPRLLLLLDHHEHSLYQLYVRFGDHVRTGRVDIALADTRDHVRMREVLTAAKPQVVFHLAAYKHVPLGEKFPEEVVAVNVFATQDLLRLAVELDVEAFAYPSSDKAVNPPSLYGATKRIAETLVQRTGEEQRQRYQVARYVNIIGTHGSVIERLAQQVLSGQPLTITDAAMTRYWITMPEAVWLLASAIGFEAPSGVSMLDAQEEVSVLDMAQRLAHQLGVARQPYPVVFTGLRPGERLREELLSPRECFTPGSLPGLLRVLNRSRAQNLERVLDLIEDLRALWASRDTVGLRSSAMAAAFSLQ
jgi:FlaA1/EpsC-like NDP-sugar epimerase